MQEPVHVLQPCNGKPNTWQLWVYVHDDRNAGSLLLPAV